MSEPFTAASVRPCACCGKPIMHGGQVTFYRVAIEHMVIDLRAVEERHGLAMITGSGAMADVFASRSELAKPVSDPVTVLVCQNCGLMKPAAVAAMLETGQRDEEKRDQKSGEED